MSKCQNGRMAEWQNGNIFIHNYENNIVYISVNVRMAEWQNGKMAIFIHN